MRISFNYTQFCKETKKIPKAERMALLEILITQALEEDNINKPKEPDLSDVDIYLIEETLSKLKTKIVIEKADLDLPTRKEIFAKQVRSLMPKVRYDNLKKWSPTLPYEKETEKFILYWTEHNEGGRKMRFEMQKTFSTLLRMTTWFDNANTWLVKRTVLPTSSPSLKKANILTEDDLY